MTTSPIRRIPRALAVTTAAALMTFGVGGAAVSAAGASTAASTAAQSSGKTKIEVGDNFFDPEEVEIPAGTKVTWTNDGKILHNVVSTKGAKFGTKTLARGKSYSYKFKKPGKYVYYCSFHGSPTGGQRGTIVVTKPPPPTTTTPPTTAVPAG